MGQLPIKSLPRLFLSAGYEQNAFIVGCDACVAVNWLRVFIADDEEAADIGIFSKR
jgi:hypothetical protein